MPQANPSRRPRLVFIPIRVLLITLLLTLLSLAISLLVGIVGVLIMSRIRGVVPNMTVAYRFVAMPTAAAVAAVTLTVALVMEIRHYRQAKALAEIERHG